MVHKLDAALYDINRLVEEGGIDDLQNIGMRLVLGVKNGDDIAFSYFQTQVELVRLATVLIVRDKQLDIGRVQLSELFLSHFDGSCIVFTQQRQDLHQVLWIVQIVDLLNCIGVEIFLVIGWQQDSEREL